jgi:hypothetical protein
MRAETGIINQRDARRIDQPVQHGGGQTLQMVASVSDLRPLLVAGCAAQESCFLCVELLPQAEGFRPQLLSANSGAVDP